MTHPTSTSTAATTDQSQRTTSLSMMSQNKKQLDEQEFTKIFQDKNAGDHYYKLEIAMMHLDKVGNTKGPDYYIEKSRLIMQHLQQEFQKKGKEEAYLPWVRYFDISARKKEEYPGKKEGSQGFQFKRGMEDFVIKALFHSQAAQIDWRVAKKILSVPNIFPEESKVLLSLIQKDAIFNAVRAEIYKAWDCMIWSRPNALIQTAQKIFEKLSELCCDEACRDDLIEAIVSGRFDKAKLGLSHSLVLGEDGGLYLMLNRLTKEHQEAMLNENIVTKAFLKDKIPVQKPKDEQTEKEEKRKQEMYGEKVVLGKGGFGAVKLALSLFTHKGTSTGDVICIKKTRNFTILSSNGGMMYSSLQQATEATIGDYFASGVADKVFAPQTFDLAIVSHQSADQGETDHRKGYLMIEMFPQNTATRIFNDSKYQQWKYQKPYLIDVMRSTLGLLKENIAFTDLKPDNTLYDTNTLKTTIIDLGGTIKVDPGAENFEKSRFSFQTTPEYRAPEMSDENCLSINLPKALAFTCGQVMKEVVQKNDYENQQDLHTLIQQLTHPESSQRVSIQEAIDRLNQMGDDSYMEDVVFRHYIAKLEERIQTNRSSISLNEDILQTKELHISQKVTHLDPERYKDLKTDDLFQKVDSFLLPEQREQQVMVVFGAAGSGKSIALQLKFIEAVRNWKTSQPLPIYFNLANGIELATIINSMNRVLGTHITLQDLRKKGVCLYIDSFDEGLGLDSGRREILIKEYMKEVAHLSEKDAAPQVKFIVTCRTDSLLSESNYKWFTPQPNALNKLETVYIVPIDYNGHANLKDMIGTYARHNSKGDAFVEMALTKIETLHLKEMITTGFMFYAIIKVLPELTEEESKEGGGGVRRGISKKDIFRKYVSYYQEKELKRLTEEQKAQLYDKIMFLAEDQDGPSRKRTLNSALDELGKYIAVQLHLRDEFRIDQGHPLFQALGYDSAIYFKKQNIAHLFAVLPLKIETKFYSDSKSKKQSQEVKLGFIHDTIKNSYLLEVIQDEMRKNNGISRILSSKSIVADRELIRFIADAARYDLSLKHHLRQAIDLTKSDKSESAVIYAANSITILVAARYSFTCQDLSNISISGSNIRNGIFSGADFTGADLSYTNLGNIQADGAKLVKANLKAAKFGVLPDLLGHLGFVNSVIFSDDGKYLASGSKDKTVKIWDAQTFQCLSTLEGHTDEVRSVSFSGDGKHLASSSMDNTVKIWEVQTPKCSATLEGHTSEVEGVSFSHDGKYVASASSDKTVKVWEVSTSQCIMTLQGHTAAVRCVIFSRDGKLIASGSNDTKVRIWEMQTSQCIATLQGHTGIVRSVKFSPDDQYLASGSRDSNVKIWEVSTFKCLATLKGHINDVQEVTFSNDGKYLASGSYDTTVRLWEVQTSQCLETFQGHAHFVTSVSFSFDGKYIASGSCDRSVKIWEVKSSNSLAMLQGHTKGLTSVSFSGDGNYLATGSYDKTVKIWEMQTSRCLATLEGHTSDVNSVSFSANGKYIASGSNDKPVRTWDAQTSKCLKTLEGHRLNITSVHFSSTGKYIASGSLDKTVKIWDAHSSQCLATLQGHTLFVQAVCFSSNGSYVASGSGDKTVRIWAPLSTKCLTILQGHEDSVMSVSFSSDGKYLASGSGDRTVKIWDMKVFQCITTLQGHISIVKSVTFSADGAYLASGSTDNTVRIWEAHTFKCHAVLKGDSYIVNSVCFSRDGKHIAVGYWDKTMKIWININGDWFCDKIFSATNSSLTARNMVVERIVVSKRNKEILQQLVDKDKTEKNELNEKVVEYDETEGEIEHNPIFAREVVNEFTELFLKAKKAKDEKGSKEKFVRLKAIESIHNIKEPGTGKDEVPLKPKIVRNQVAPGDTIKTKDQPEQMSRCCNIF